MPKNTDATKSRMRSKSTRKPLRDVSNAKTAFKSANICKKTEENGGKTGDDSLDRLLLAHSDLSSLLRQIDELVVQAIQLTSNKGRKEIKQFADVLSDMQTSLKPWVPRFQKALSSQCTGPENKPQLMESTVVYASEESISDVTESPKQTKWESLVSPSPLVSWRAECNTEGGRQLFLLTPLPQTKAFSSKCQASSIPAFDKVKSDGIPHPVSFFDSLGNLGNDLPESISAKPTRKKVLDIEANKAVGNLDTKCASPGNYSKINCDMFITTPCLKMSPPKSCILLEPVSEFSRKKNQGVHKSTPYPTGVHNPSESLDSESSSNQTSDDLKVKYPELFGIKLNNLVNRKVPEDSPNWIVSPPKTCVIMEPSDEKLLTNLDGNILLPETMTVHSQPNDLSTVNKSHYQGNSGIAVKTHQQDISSALVLDESTPMIKEPISSFRIGKPPGENTLKKELWTKFEAATTHSIRFNGSVLQKTAEKGFLDRLDEASDDSVSLVKF
ncbi:uncharacterized protein LOC105157689 [Sesamum indicum]|uniref:Uncharacterized protein LOC105157689 n=1 Tax=Sesamum indicum TaxID=4182 RepID=A0A6I9SQP2_SESIN|nr:uncharacterized protein LOC105157689 [Sesamum indicum]